MANDLQVGSVVQLKSGGPLITVSFISKANPGVYDCVWFLNGEIKKDTFQGDTLKIVKEQ